MAFSLSQQPPQASQYWYCDVCGAAWLDAECTLNTNLLSVVLPASCSYSAVYTAAKPATCDEPGNTEYWYCANCDVYYADAACAIVTNAKNVIIPISHNVIHVEAVAATCTTDGNIEYWYCADCGQAWLDEYCHLNTNLMSVVLPASCSYGAVYTAAKAATCDEPGNVEYWYCANCDVYYADAACAIVTNAKNVIIPITHNIVAVEAKAPTCTENGNIAYWYCADCGAAWLDEYCHLNTNLKAVVLPAAHTYDNDYDVDCNVCGEIREAPLAPVITTIGTSVCEDVNGLAFLFKADVELTTINEESHVANYSNATVNGSKLIKMGAVVSNTGEEVDLDDVNNNNVLNIEAKYLHDAINEENDAATYAIRVINIPDEYKDREIDILTYIIFEDEAGVQYTLYCDSATNTYNDFV